MEDPLDFEAEDRLLSTPRPGNKRRKLIGLDDLLSDYYMESSKPVERKSKSKYNSDDEDDKTQKKKEKMLSKFVDDCQKQVHELNAEDEMPLWGQRTFGKQKTPPSANFSGLGNCKLLQSLSKIELNSILDLNIENGESFLEGLLSDGWLLKLTFSCGFVEDSIASWTFYKMLYSSNEDLQASACDFWSRILLSKIEGDGPGIRLGWSPSYSDFKNALEIYGYQSDTSSNCPSPSTTGCEGPPANVISWLKVLSACCRIRSAAPIFSTCEIEEFLGVILCLSLDRQLLGLSYILYEGMQSVINFFMDSEWNASRDKVAAYIALRIPKDLNSLRVVESIPGINARGKQLKSKVAFQILVSCFDGKISTGEEILEYLVSISVKDKHCDFFKMYLYLVLAENWLLIYHSSEEKPVLLTIWCKYLQNCSTQITSTDWRPFAAKVRNKASYLLQNSMQRRNC